MSETRGQALAVIGVGITSSVGKLARTSCAAIRAGIAGIAEHPVFKDASGEALQCSLLSWLSEDPDPSTRLCDAARLAVREALQGTRFGVSLQGIYLIRDDHGRSFNGLEAALLSEVHGDCRHDHRLNVLSEGNAGGIKALHQLSHLMAHDDRACALIIGIDSLVEASTLRRLEATNRLKRESRPRGLCPGEAAAALLVCSLNNARKWRLPIMAVLSSVATTLEHATIYDDEPVLATGLTACLHRAIDNRLLPPTLDVYCDLNGEPYRSHEWTLASLRALSIEHELHHPADCIGDVGAASAPMLIALATLDLPARQGWSARDISMVFCSSDHGLRGATLVESPTSHNSRGEVSWK